MLEFKATEETMFLFVKLRKHHSKKSIKYVRLANERNYKQLNEKYKKLIRRKIYNSRSLHIFFSNVYYFKY